MLESGCNGMDIRTIDLISEYSQSIALQFKPWDGITVSVYRIRGIMYGPRNGLPGRNIARIRGVTGRLKVLSKPIFYEY